MADQGLTGQNGMAKPFHLHLAGIGERTGIDDVANVLQQRFRGRARNLMLQFVGNVKVIFDGAFAPP